VGDAQTAQQPKVQRIDDAAQVDVIYDLGRAVVAAPSARRPLRQYVGQLRQASVDVGFSVVASRRHFRLIDVRRGGCGWSRDVNGRILALFGKFLAADDAQRRTN
jgi:hypothetical protein